MQNIKQPTTFDRTVTRATIAMHDGTNTSRDVRQALGRHLSIDIY